MTPTHLSASSYSVCRFSTAPQQPSLRPQATTVTLGSPSLMQVPTSGPYGDGDSLGSESCGDKERSIQAGICMSDKRRTLRLVVWRLPLMHSGLVVSAYGSYVLGPAQTQAVWPLRYQNPLRGPTQGCGGSVNLPPERRTGQSSATRRIASESMTQSIYKRTSTSGTAARKRERGRGPRHWGWRLPIEQGNGSIVYYCYIRPGFKGALAPCSLPDVAHHVV